MPEEGKKPRGLTPEARIKGSHTRSENKARASRENGKKGGRPRKSGEIPKENK